MKRCKKVLIIFMIFIALGIAINFNSINIAVFAANEQSDTQEKQATSYSEEDYEDNEEEGTEYKANYDEYAMNENGFYNEEEQDETITENYKSQSSSKSTSSLIAAGEVDTDELTDWKISVDDKDNGDTFEFIKNADSSDKTNNGKWLLYGGISLICLAVLGVLYVIISSVKPLNKGKRLSR